MTSNEALVDDAVKACRGIAQACNHISPCHPLAQEVETLERRKLLKAWSGGKSTKVTRHPRRPKIVFTTALGAEDGNQIAVQGLQ